MITRSALLSFRAMFKLRDTSEEQTALELYLTTLETVQGNRLLRKCNLPVMIAAAPRYLDVGVSPQMLLLRYVAYIRSGGRPSHLRVEIM